MDPAINTQREGFFNALNNDPEIHQKMANMMNEVMEDEFEIPASKASVPSATELQNIEEK